MAEPSKTDNASSAEQDACVIEEARLLEALLPTLMRRLFSLDPTHPVTEMPLAQLRTCTILISGPKSMSMLGDEMGISVSAITQIADRMVRSGLVERTTGPEDRRQKLLQLTAFGSELMRSRRELRVERVTQVLRKLSPDARKSTLCALSQLLDAATDSTGSTLRDERLLVR